MVSRIRQLTLDVHDVGRMAEFWSAVLGYRAELGDDGCGKLYPPDDAPAGELTVWLQAVDEAKAGKNRDHPDLRADGDVDAEVERLLGLGARHVDVGQKDDDPFVVLADPEGNEFCLLRNPPRRSGP
jgi:hypothetical protein